MEYLYDGRKASEPTTIYDDDLFIGTRLAWNDAADSSVLAGAMVDRRDDEWFITVEAERRLGENWFGEARLRLFQGGDDPDGLYVFERDDYLQLSLQRYF